MFHRNAFKNKAFRVLWNYNFIIDPLQDFCGRLTVRTNTTLILFAGVDWKIVIDKFRNGQEKRLFSYKLIAEG